jgi:hypothetical protein
VDSTTKRLDDVTVTLTAKDLAFRERAREAGIPPMVVSMYSEALQRLVEDEREECAKLCDYRVGIWIIPAGPAECAAAIRRRGEK